MAMRTKCVTILAAAVVLSVAADGGVFAGAKVAFLGDSITDKNHIGCTSNYWNYLERDVGVIPLVYGRNGAQWTGVFHQAELLKKEHPQGISAIFVFAGTNDYNSDVPLGEWFSVAEKEVDRGKKGTTVVKCRSFVFSDDTFRGRINKVMNRLKDDYPGTPIYVMTPIHRGYAAFGPGNVQPDESHSNGIGLFIDDYVAAVKEVGNVWAVNVIDLNAESGLFPMLKSHSRFFSNEERDMLHPNNAGHELIEKAILRRMSCNGQSCEKNAIRSAEQHKENPK